MTTTTTDLETLAFNLRRILRARGVQVDGPASVLPEWTAALSDAIDATNLDDQP
jgi:hypothetical protein